MLEKCRNGHPRVGEDGTSNVYVYPTRPGRRPRITCRICRDGEPVERPSQEERVAKLAEIEVAKVVPTNLNAFGQLRFWGLCNAIVGERYPLRMAWLMAQLTPGLLQDVRDAADLLERGVYVFDAHDGDIFKIRARMEGSAPAKDKETTMRSFEELVPYDELPAEVENIGQTCEHEAPVPCSAAADVSIWKDFGVHGHRWTEWTALCRDHFDPRELPSYARALPLTEYAIETLGLDGPPSD